MYECVYCNSITPNDKNTICISINPDDTEFGYDVECILCDNCQRKHQKKGDNQIRQVAKKHARKEVKRRERMID